jgi:hypothetical protein
VRYSGLVRSLALLLTFTLGCAHAASDQRTLARFQEEALAQHDRVFFLAAREPAALGLDPEGEEALRELKARDQALREDTRALAKAVTAGESGGPALRAALLPLRAGRADLEARADALYARVLPKLASSARITLAARAELPRYLELTRVVVRVDGREQARAHALGSQLRGLFRGSLPEGPHVVRVHAWFRGRGGGETGRDLGELSFAVARALAVRARADAPAVITISLEAEPRAGIDHRVPVIRLKQAR